MPSTAAAIRDRITALITAATPTFDSRTKFRASQNIGSANFLAEAASNPTGAFRRFQVRDDGTEEPPEVSNTDTDMRHVTYEIRVAYPQTQRYGKDGALDRDDVIDQDWGKLERLVGIYARANYSGTNDCTPLGATRETEIGESVDFLVIRARFSYYRAVAPEIEADMRQVFRYTATGGESTFNVSLPRARRDASYAVDVEMADADSQLTFNAPLSGRTVTEFQLVCSSPLTAGDVLEITVEDLQP